MSERTRTGAAGTTAAPAQVPQPIVGPTVAGAVSAGPTESELATPAIEPSEPSEPETAPGARESLVLDGFGYRHAGRKAWALRNITASIPPGQKVLILGASGIGKSTLLHAIAGVLPEPGADGAGERAGTITGVPRGSAGLVLQDPDSQLVCAKVGEEVAFGPENMGVAPELIPERIEGALGVVGLGNLGWEHPTFALSGGQKQRLALASVLAMRPQLLLLDEPTANLDPGGALQMRDAVVRAAEARGASALIVEHRVDLWAPVVDRVLVLGPVGILADGSPAQVLENPATRSELVRAGVWIPGYVPRTEPVRPTAAALEVPGVPGAPGVPGVPGAPGAPNTDRATPVRATSERTATGTSPVLRADGLSVGRVKKAPPALEGVELDFAPGHSYVVMGPNGAGKSTLALSLAGLLEPLRGSVLASAQLLERPGEKLPRSQEPYRWKSAQLVSRIGTVFQEPEAQFLCNTVREELAFGPRRILRAARRGASAGGSRGAAHSVGDAGQPARDSDVDTQVTEMARRIGLEPLLRANPFTLSGGQKRRLSLACMLISRPDVLILDEPTFGQDANTWAALVDMLADYVSDGGTLISVTHDELFARALDSRIIRVRDGRALEEAA